MTVWREPAEESRECYPGLVVADNRVSGSITLGPSRMPIWATIPDLVDAGFDEIAEIWDMADFNWDKQQMSAFLSNLLEMRGEFARLLLVLADAERDETERDEVAYEAGRQADDTPWWHHEPSRQRVREQLQRCLDTLSSTTG
jgi:hypothetical protein